MKHELRIVRSIAKLFTMQKCMHLFFALGFLFFTSRAFAVTEGSLGAYPTNYDVSNPKTKSWFIYELKPGETKDDSITIVNNTDKTLDVKVYPVDATTTNDGAFALLNENQKQSDVGSWVHLSKNIVTIPPRDRRDVPFTISIPNNTTVGDHAGGIIVQEAKTASQGSEGIGLNIISRVGTRIYETVPGQQVVSLDLRGLAYKIGSNHLVFTFTLENKGNIILTPTGSVEVKEISGKVIDKISLGNLGSVLPGKPTNITAKSNSEAPLFGQYTATVTINYSPIKAIAKSISFFIYVKDWRLMLPVPIVIALMMFVFLIRKIFFHGFKLKEIASDGHRHRILQAKSDGHVSSDGSPMKTALATAGIPEENIDGLFVAKHIKLLVVFVSISIIILSSLFAFILQYFVLSRVAVQGAKTTVPLEKPAPTTSTPPPTPTDVPVKKSDMKIDILNGSGRAGGAKTVAETLAKDGFTVEKTGNALEDVAQTIIQYPKGGEDGAAQLINELKPAYTDIQQEEASDSAFYTVTLDSQ